MKKMILITVIFSQIFLFSMQGRPKNKDVQVFKKWELTRDLNLSEKQAEAFFPRVNDLENRLADLQQQETKLYREMNQMIDNHSVDDKRMDEILDEISSLERTKIDMIHDHMKNIDDILTPEQKARYGVFERKFKRQMKNKLSKRYQHK